MKMVSSPPPTLYVIIPVYNREDYIEQCVSSVLRQTYPNIVVVCVDDGSIDQSPTILKKIAKDHTNVVVLTKTNGGPSSARNAGLDYIDGKEGYFTFVDSDDWISDDFCEYYMKALLEKQCAAVKTGRYNSCVIELTRNEALCALARHEIWYGPVCLFANIQSIRGLRFDKTLAIGEDLLWNVSLINRINGLVIVPDTPKTKYHCEMSVMSLSRSRMNNAKLLSQFYTWYKCLPFYKDTSVLSIVRGNLITDYLELYGKFDKKGCPAEMLLSFRKAMCLVVNYNLLDYSFCPKSQRTKFLLYRFFRPLFRPLYRCALHYRNSSWNAKIHKESD